MTPALRAVCCAAFLLLLSGCGGSDTPKPGAPGIPPAPVDVLYNNGVDALNAQRYQRPSTSSPRWNRTIPIRTGRRTPSSCRATPSTCEQNYTEAIGHAGPLHPAASGQPRHRLCLLPARALLLRADRRRPARPEGHAEGDGGAAGGGEPLPRHRLCPRRAAEDRPRAATISPARRWRSAASTSASTCTKPRSAASSAWWTTSRPPTTCRGAAPAGRDLPATSACAEEAKRTAAVLGYNYPGSSLVRRHLRPACATTGW